MINKNVEINPSDSHLDNCFQLNNSEVEFTTSEEEEIEVEVRGEWDGGSVDSGWLEATLEEVNSEGDSEEEA